MSKEGLHLIVILFTLTDPGSADPNTLGPSPLPKTASCFQFPNGKKRQPDDFLCTHSSSFTSSSCSSRTRHHPHDQGPSQEDRGPHSFQWADDGTATFNCVGTRVSRGWKSSARGRRSKGCEAGRVATQHHQTHSLPSIAGGYRRSPRGWRGQQLGLGLWLGGRR